MTATGIASRLTSGKSLIPRANVRELFSCCFGGLGGGGGGAGGFSSNTTPAGDDLTGQPTKRYGSTGFEYSYGDDVDTPTNTCGDTAKTGPRIGVGITIDGDGTSKVERSGGKAKRASKTEYSGKSSNTSRESGVFCKRDSSRISSKSGRPASKGHSICMDGQTHHDGTSSSSDDEDAEIMEKYQISMKRSQSLHSSINGKRSQKDSIVSGDIICSEADIPDALEAETASASHKLLLLDTGSRISSKQSSRHSSRYSFDENKSVGNSSTSYDNDGFNNDIRIEISEDGSNLSVHNDKTPLSSSPESRATGYGSIAHDSEAPPPSSVVTSQRGHDVTGRQELDQSTTSSKQTSSISPPAAVTSQISRCGFIEMSFEYHLDHQKLAVNIHSARDVPNKERGGSNSTQIRLLLLPKRKIRYKTKIISSEDDCPDYNQSFSFKLAMEEACSYALRVRLYGCERMRRERMIGECIVTLSDMGGASLLEGGVTEKRWISLEPRCNIGMGDCQDVSSLSRTDSQSSTQSLQHGGMPELFIGLGYNGTTGRLSVEVIKGSNFRNMAMTRAPDTYVKLTLMSPNGQEIGHSKTSIRRAQPNPLFKETFMFQVALFQLSDITLMVSVYNKRNMKRKDMIGWFSLGYNNSGEEELSHWTDMRDTKGTQVCRWHVLLEA